jgi:hypothetical protein
VVIRQFPGISSFYEIGKTLSEITSVVDLGLIDSLNVLEHFRQVALEMPRR